MNNISKKIFSPRNLGTVIAILAVTGATALAQIPAYKSWLTQGANLYTTGTKVGIGTTTPITKLEVISPDAISPVWQSEGVRVSASGSNAGLGVDGAGTNYGVALFHGGNRVFTVDSNYGALIGQSYVFGQDGTPNGLLVEGNVGIGTTGPGVPLEVVRTTAGTQDLITVDNPSGDPSTDTAIRFRNSTNHMGRISAERATNNFNIQNLQPSSPIRFLLGSILNSGEVMRIAGSGNVGIGTANPTEKLQVAGVVHSTSGGFRFPDGTVQTSAGVTGGGVTSLNGLNGPVTIAGGGSASVSVSGNTITVSTPTCTPQTVPIACSGTSNCSATCPSGYVINNWSCSLGTTNISGTTGTCPSTIGGAQGSGSCQVVC